MYSVYALLSLKERRIYVGLSGNVEKRIQEHNSGRVFSTKGFRPWKLIHQELVGTRQEARNREKYLKSGIGKEWLKQTYLPR
ncbi:MAG: GIY-YIG nuclease family protein [Patescibacteria group bacterium]